MLTHTATVRGRAITWDHREVVQHGLNADRVELVTDREWQECDRVVAVLAKAGKESVRVDAGDGFFIPSALMEDAGPLRMCLLGYKGDSVRIVTAKEDAPLCVVESGEVAGMDPAPEQPDLWAQLMEEVRKATDGAKTAAQSATRAEADLRAAAERGDFDGEDGKTPVRGVDYWTAEDRKPIEDATLAATTAAGRADAAAKVATEGEASRAVAEAARAKAEQARVVAETGRVEAENGRVIADAERGERVDAAVQKADAATAKATEAAGKATASATEADAAAKRADEAAKGASKNVLKGAGYGTIVNVNDAWPSPVLRAKVLGRSEQLVTTGKNIAPTLYKWSEVQKAYKYRLSLDAGPQYVASVNRIPSGFVGQYAMRVVNRAGEQKQIVIDYRNNADKSKPFAVESGDLLEFDCSNGVSAELAAELDIQVEKGATATAYEPYTGGKPSPSPDYPQEITNLNKAELVITGKNLINPNRLAQIDSSCYQAVDGQLKVIISHNSAWKDVPIYGTLQAGTYTLSGDNIEIRDTALNQIVNIMSTQVKQFTLNNPTSIKMKVGYGWPKYPVITKAQLEVGSKATAYEPHKSKNTVIDLKGNELCSLPNGVKDEVVIDADGNVSLIKRVAKIDALTVNLKYMQKQNNNKWVAFKSFPEFTSWGETKGAISSKFIHKYLLEDATQYGNFTITTDGNLCFGIPESLCPKEGDWASVTPEVNAWFDGLKEGLFIYASYKKPQTIPLGKVELPALPEATSNVWNDGNIPANVYINYLKDVNIAFADLESKLTQAVVATAANL